MDFDADDSGAMQHVLADEIDQRNFAEFKIKDLTGGTTCRTVQHATVDDPHVFPWFGKSTSLTAARWSLDRFHIETVAS